MSAPLRTHPAERDAPAPVVAPSGVYRVLKYDGANASEASTHVDREAAQESYRRLKGPKALARGATVLRHDGCSKADVRAFGHFAATTLAGAPVAAKPETVEREPARMSVSVDRVSLVVETDDEQPVTEELVVPERRTEKRTVKTKSAPVANSSKPSKCSKCSKKPAARACARTRKGQETWCAACRKASLDAGYRGAPEPTTAKPAAKARRQDLPATQATPARIADEVWLAYARRVDRVLERLGGIERAEQLAAVIGGAS